jgi:hypothetical protein
LYFDGVLSLRDPADKRLGHPFDRFSEGLTAPGATAALPSSAVLF